MNALQDNGGPDRIRAKMETITPEQASHLIESMIGNRPVSQRRVNAMAADLKAGKWAENGETVIIDGQGRLIDGQHRMWSIVEANVPMRTLVVRGVDAATFPTIDTGRYRTDADVLSITDRGLRSPKLHAAALRLVLWWEGGYSEGDFKAIVADRGRLLAVHERHPTLYKSVAFCGSGKFAGLMRPSVAIFAHYMGARFGREHDPDRFWDSVSSGIGLQKGMPALALREYLRRRHSEGAKVNNRRTVDSHDEAEVCLRAWNAHCEGRELDRVLVGETVPEVFGFARAKAAPAKKKAAGREARR